MKIPGGNHLDRRRQLQPLDYIEPPGAFGRRETVRVVVPEGGDRTSAIVALIQHEIVRSWHTQRGHTTDAALSRRFGFSKQTLSKVMVGERWVGETVLAILIYALRELSVARQRDIG